MKKSWLETLDTPVVNLSGARGEAAAPAARLAALEARVAAIEVWLHHGAGITRAIRRAAAVWPGPFSARDIYEIVRRGRIAVTFAGVSQHLQRLAKRGGLEIIRPGAGRVPTLYEHLAGMDHGAGCPRGTHHANTSGLICGLRRALPELPEQFSLDDVRTWMDAHWPGKKPANLGGYLAALRASGDIEVTRPRGHGPGAVCQLYRATNRNAPNGERLTAHETAWRAFRSTLKIEPPEILFGNSRDT